MAHAASWKDPVSHYTYNRGDEIYVTGTVYYSGDAVNGGQHGTYTRLKCYFYSYFTASWDVTAPICIGKEPGTAWAYVKVESIVQGGTPEYHKVYYNGNGNTDGQGEWSEWATYGQPYTILSNWYTRAGHNFSGWERWGNPSEDWTSSIGQPWVWRYTEDVWLYAKWTPWQHTVAYWAPDASGCPGPQTKTYGSISYISSQIPVRTGYEFVCWNTQGDGNGTRYNAGQPYGSDQNGGTVWLYAIWKKITYNVTYNANGGKNAPAAQTFEYNASVVLSSAKPVREDYEFLYWCTTKDGKGTRYDPGDTYAQNANLTLYAIWKEVDNIAYVKEGSTWNYGPPYVHKAGEMKMAQRVYCKKDGKWIQAIK